MGLQQELELYSKALEDWLEKYPNTFLSFCSYFETVGVKYKSLHRLIGKRTIGNTYHFENTSQRLEALIACIAEIKNELKQEGL